MQDADDPIDVAGGVVFPLAVIADEGVFGQHG